MTEDERKAAETADVSDALVVLGLLLLGASVWMLWGGPAVAAYAGALLVIFGVVLAMQRGRRHDAK
jgi:hypothetical protein